MKEDFIYSRGPVILVSIANFIITINNFNLLVTNRLDSAYLYLRTFLRDADVANYAWNCLTFFILRGLVLYPNSIAL